MQQKRSLFSKVFGKKESDILPQNASELKILNGYLPVFTNYNGQFYDDSDIRACVDTIARNTAKLSPKHIRNGQNGIEPVEDNIFRILNKRPNEIQNAFQFYYIVVTELMLFNDAYVYIMKDDKSKVVGLYPLHFQNLKFFEYKNEIYIKFNFGTGQSKFVPLKECIHLTRFVGKDGLVGGNTQPIIKSLSIKHVIDEGIINAIKTTQSIRGILKSSKAILKAEDVRKMRNQFVEDFIQSYDGSGIGGLDASTDFKEISLNPVTANESQIKNIDNRILSYFGVNENIIQSKFSEDEWNAFYESVIEPIALQMSMEFTNKLFSATEIYHGNEIIFTSNRLQYASNDTKINLIRYANNILMIDELREVFNLEPLPDGAGKKVMQDLNHIDSNIANQYQTEGGEEK